MFSFLLCWLLSALTIGTITNGTFSACTAAPVGTVPPIMRICTGAWPQACCMPWRSQSPMGAFRSVRTALDEADTPPILRLAILGYWARCSALGSPSISVKPWPSIWVLSSCSRRSGGVSGTVRRSSSAIAWAGTTVRALAPTSALCSPRTLSEGYCIDSW